MSSSYGYTSLVVWLVYHPKMPKTLKTFSVPKVFVHYETFFILFSQILCKMFGD